MQEIPSCMMFVRSVRGLSQEQLAGKLGVSQSLISQYENGVREPVYQAGYLIAKMLKFPQELLTKPWSPEYEVYLDMPKVGNENHSN